MKGSSDLDLLFDLPIETYRKFDNYESDWIGITVHAFATSGGSGIGKTAEKLEPYVKGTETVDAKLVHSANEL